MRALIHSFHDINNNAPTRFINKLYALYASYIAYLQCLNISKYLAYTKQIVPGIANINYTECIKVFHNDNFKK